jgi:hypothetical protein
MEGKTIRISASQLIVLFVTAVVLGGLLLFFATYVLQNGFPHFGPLTRNSKTMSINSIEYKDVPNYVDSRVAVQGFVIITNDTQNICGASGWATCKTWFSYDPFTQGLGPHTVKISIGTGPDSITESGNLFDHNGTHLNLIKTDQFSWYHVAVTGLVEQCKKTECIIDVDTVYALP